MAILPALALSPKSKADYDFEANSPDSSTNETKDIHTFHNEVIRRSVENGSLKINSTGSLNFSEELINVLDVINKSSPTYNSPILSIFEENILIEDLDTLETIMSESGETITSI